MTDEPVRRAQIRLLAALHDGMEFREEVANLIENYLDDIAFNRFTKIMRATGYSRETLRGALQERKSLPVEWPYG